MRENYYRLALCFLLLCYFLLGMENLCAMKKEKAITLEVVPPILLVGMKGDGQVRVTVRIARNEGNRYRSLSWVSDEGQSGSQLNDMQGESSAITYQSFVVVTQGLYVFEACVYQPQKFCVRQDVSVMGS